MPMLICVFSQDVMWMKEESSSCYCVLESHRCFVLMDQPGRYALVGMAISDSAVKRLRIAVFGSSEGDVYTLRVYCIDDTPHAFQVTLLNANIFSQQASFFFFFGGGDLCTNYMIGV